MSLVEEIERRALRASFSAEALCFGPQLAFVRSRAKRKVARCSRRAGKTTGVAIGLLEHALQPPYANQIYVTISLKNAKRLVWPTVKRLNDHFKLGGVPNETEGFVKFPHLPNEPHIFLGGAKDKSEIDKLRGYEGGAKRAIIDEAQSMRTSLLQELVDDVIEPALFDYDGELDVIGTPGAVKSGYFYDIDVGHHRKGWEHFMWTLRDNEFLQKKSGKHPDQILAELRERRAWSEDHPTYVREYLGLWKDDPDALVLHYLAQRNHYEVLPPLQHYVLGVDIGHDDADAIAVLGWADREPDLYIVEEYLKRGATVSDLAERIEALRKVYNPMRIVADFGGLGKKIGDEMVRRWGIPVEAAEKQRKLEHVALLDDALRTGRLRARVGSAFAEDCALVQWDADSRARGVLKIADEPHSDIVDAVLYGYRACYQYLYQAPAPGPTAQQKLDAWELREMERIERRKTADWWDGMGAGQGYD